MLPCYEQKLGFKITEIKANSKFKTSFKNYFLTILAKKTRHHYNPVFYLEGFIDPKNHPFVWVYEKGKDCIFKSKPENIAFERHYHSYITTTGEKDTETLEDILNKFETPAAQIFEKLKSFHMPNEEERKIFSRYLGISLTRVPNFRKNVESAVAKLFKFFLEMNASNEQIFKEMVDSFEHDTGKKIGMEIETLRKYQLEGKYDIHVKPHVSLSMIFLGLELSEIFNNMTWVFIKATDRFKLLTSDNPLYYDDPTRNHNVFFGVSLTDKNVEVSFPISSEVAFIGTWEKNLREGFIQGSHELIKNINRKTVASALRYIYSSQRTDGIARLVQKYKNIAPSMKII